MLDIEKTIDGLENLNKRIGFSHSAVCDAIKVLRMHRRLRNACRNYDMGQVTKLQITRILDGIEEEFFPSLMTKTIKIKLEVPTEEGLARVEQIKNYTQKKLKIFNDVKEVIISE